MMVSLVSTSGVGADSWAGRGASADCTSTLGVGGAATYPWGTGPSYSSSDAKWARLDTFFVAIASNSARHQNSWRGVPQLKQTLFLGSIGNNADFRVLNYAARFIFRSGDQPFTVTFVGNVRVQRTNRLASPEMIQSEILSGNRARPVTDRQFEQSTNIGAEIPAPGKYHILWPNTEPCICGPYSPSAPLNG